MARKKRRKPRTIASTRITDDELIAQLQDRGLHASPLDMSVSESEFERTLENLMMGLPDDRPHFYCRKCGEYHLKTHPHYLFRQT